MNTDIPNDWLLTEEECGWIIANIDDAMGRLRYVGTDSLRKCYRRLHSHESALKQKRLDKEKAVT